MLGKYISDSALNIEYTDEMKERDERLYQFNLLLSLKDNPEMIYQFSDKLKVANTRPI